MIHTHIDKERAVPLWAAIGAPIIGVPLMVALLALAAPPNKSSAVEPESTVHSEQVDLQTVDQTVSVPVYAMGSTLQRC